jgi:hypothetical protein
MREENERDEDEYAKTVEDIYNSVKLSPSARASKWIEDKVRGIEKAFNAGLVMKMHRDRRFISNRQM